MSFQLFSKLLFTSLFIVFFVISGVFFSISILKDEAIKTHLKLVQLYSSIFVDNFSRTINGMDFLVNNINSYLIYENTDFSTLDNKLQELLKNNPEVRSINIVDENNQIISSSNSLNKNFNINLDSFYPNLNLKLICF